MGAHPVVIHFCGKPTGTSWDPDHIARAWAELMRLATLMPLTTNRRRPR